ncbi:hypothetical protein Tco_1154591 [Tanacetum coccineum]
MGKENMKELVPRDLSPTSYLGNLKEQTGSLYRTCEIVRMIENPEEIHKAKAQDDKRDMDVGWDIMSKDVERLSELGDKEFDLCTRNKTPLTLSWERIPRLDFGVRVLLEGKQKSSGEMQESDKKQGKKDSKTMAGVDVDTLTMKQYLALSRENQAPGMVKPEIGGNVIFEIKSQFMRELREDTFFENKDEDAHDHIDRVLSIVGLFNIPGVSKDGSCSEFFPLLLPDS